MKSFGNTSKKCMPLRHQAALGKSKRDSGSESTIASSDTSSDTSETSSDTSEWLEDNEEEKFSPKDSSSFVEQLQSCQLRSHLASTVGGNKSSKAINTLISRVSVILSWLQNLWPGKSTIQQIITELLRVNYQVMAEFICHLREVMSKQASTALAYLEDFMKFLNFYVLFHGQRNRQIGR